MVQTFVAMTIWSRLPRAFIHSPRIFSEVSFWLENAVNAISIELEWDNLLIVRSVNEISTTLAECIQKLETTFFIHGAHEALPATVADRRGSKAEG